MNVRDGISAISIVLGIFYSEPRKMSGMVGPEKYEPEKYEAEKYEAEKYEAEKYEPEKYEPEKYESDGCHFADFLASFSISTF
jgi:hypothetical protein